ncbi:hypothetical protein L1049_021109 [Liquidambar formosana]|uniref:Uncharacterized protein n=1 Tax=Liquidambar formosana TaxID=63359 RepID=A0AAP0XAM7_LIQFO
MRPSAILRTLSLRIPSRLSASPAVAPLPVPTSFDQQITTELDALQSERGSDADYTSANWLLQALDASTNSQKIALESFANVMCRDSDRKAVDDYLEDSVELLDSCNGLLEKMEVIHKYVDSLRRVLHLLDGRFEPNPIALARASDVLDSCEAIEKRCSEMGKCGSGLRKLSLKLAQGTSSCATKVGWHESELSLILSGSKAVALTACGVLGIALSFKSKRGFPTMQSRPATSWSSSLQELQKGLKEQTEKQKRSGSVMMSELRGAVMAASGLRDQIKSRKKDDNGVNVEELKRRCEELEEGIKPMEGRVKELYRHLISIRVALLGILSRA